jgi:gluconolactonase
VGTIYTGGIARCRADGTFEHLSSPDPMTTNICFGDTDMGEAYLTLSASGRIGKVRWSGPGQPLAY